MDYKHAAQQVLDCIGGKDNILSAAHCATRLRLVIADNAKVNKQELENAEGAKGVFEAQGQLQIIFGTGTVNKVYDEFIQLAGIEGGSKEDVKQAAAAKAPWYQRAIKTLGDIFVPIIPAIVASGFLMGIMEALNFMVNNGFLNIDTTGSVYVFAKLFSNTAYTFLPILIAYSAAKVFGGNPYLGAVIGMIMIHPDLQNAWTVSNGVNVMQPVFGGLYSVPLVGYQGHVIPVIIAVWLMCQIEKQQVLDCIGGKDNILSAAHCATRLRLVIADNAKVNKQELENAEGAKGVFEAQGQLQIIFGTGTVNKVYDEFIQLAGIEGGSKEDVKQAAAAKAPWYQRAIKTLGDIFVPIIPAIVASGFLMGIMEALNFMVNNGFLNIDTTGSVYVFAKLFSNTAYTFLPILIAYSAAKVFGGNPYLGAVIGMIMIHPDLQNAWTVSNGVNVMQPVFGGLYSVPLVGYQGHVIPVIIAVWLMCQIEKQLHKVVPAMFDLFVTPLVSVFVTGYLTLAAIGPVFTKLENGIITGVQTLITLPYGIGSFIMGGLYAVTVVAGIHHMYTLIDLGQLARYGYTYWLPLASAANVAQGGAALAVALKSKDTKVKSMALPSALSACMGITEPAIFGVNLRYFKPFLGGLLGGACGAWYASIVGLGATGTGVTGIFGILLHLHMPLQYIIMMAISFGVSFAVTWLIWSPEEVKA